MIIQQNKQIDVAIVGAGIAGLAHAYALAKRGLKVHVFERHARAWGASVRNFGLFWPIGQEDHWQETASYSGHIWQSLSKEAGFWLEHRGALMLAYWQEEWDVLEEFYALQASEPKGRDLKMLNRAEIESQYPLVNSDNLIGGLYSQQELIVNPREAIPAITVCLEQSLGVVFHFNTPVESACEATVASKDQRWEADVVIICNGSDFETLYPDVFEAQNMVKCHLQMMKGCAPGGKYRPPVLCSGLSLLHYASFAHCQSLERLREKCLEEFPEEMASGIHVLLAENGEGDWIIGDSHRYNNDPQPSRDEAIDVNILSYLRRFAKVPQLEIKERWMGTYAVVPGKKSLFTSPEQRVWIATGLGGSGMTLSFGFAEENIKQILDQNSIDEKKQDQHLAF